MYPSEPLVRILLEKPALLYSGVRKIVQDVTWELQSDSPRFGPVFSRTFEEIGYSKNKLMQLKRNYIDPVEFDRVRAILKKRENQQFTSVALLMRGAKKDSRSMGWCMLNFVITRSKNFEAVEVQYRSTEAILKFGGDLCFIPWIFDVLGLRPNVVRFRFVNAFLSGVFFPTLIGTEGGWEPIDFLNTLWEKDRRLFAAGTRFFLRSAYKKDQRFPYSPENQQHKFLWSRVGPKKIAKIRDYLEYRHKEFGKPLPKIHYGLHEEYVPRGKRGD